MTIQIWKYPLEVTDGPQFVSLPRAAKVLFVREQGNQPTMWVEVDPDVATCDDRSFVVVGTGHSYTHNCHYIGSAFCGPFVWHVLEAK